MGLATVLGIGQAFSSPALSGLMPQLTSSSNLHQANAIKASATGQRIGSDLTGELIAVASRGWAHSKAIGQYPDIGARHGNCSHDAFHAPQDASAINDEPTRAPSSGLRRVDPASNSRRQDVRRRFGSG